MDANGALIPLPLCVHQPRCPVGFITSVPAKFNGGFVQADYLVLPWIMAIGRWDGVNSSADRINGLALPRRHRRSSGRSIPRATASPRACSS